MMKQSIGMLKDFMYNFPEFSTNCFMVTQNMNNSKADTPMRASYEGTSRMSLSSNMSADLLLPR